MRLRLKDTGPDVDADAWVSPNAVLAGAVTVERGASLWFNAVLRADGDAISIGEESNIQDGVTVHADPGFPVVIARHVSVGHGAVLHGCSVGEGSLIGMRSVVLNGAEFEARSLIAGAPATRRRSLTDEECADLAQNARDYLVLADRYRDATPG